MSQDVMSMFRSDGAVEVRCQDALDLLRSLESGSIDLVLTDPPYGISYQSNRSEAGSVAIASDWNFQFGPFLMEVGRVLPQGEGGAAYIFTRWDVYPLWHRSLGGSNLSAKNLIVWEKDNHSAGDLRGNFGFKWEGIMMLTKGRHELRGHRHSNIWSFPRVSPKARIHPAEKPVPLLQRIIEASTDRGGMVVDPFCGSGSTAEAALWCGRRALIGDVDTRWLQACADRLGLVGFEHFLPPPPLIDLSVLDGVHPEDVQDMLVSFLGAGESEGMCDEVPCLMEGDEDGGEEGGTGGDLE